MTVEYNYHTTRSSWYAGCTLRAQTERRLALLADLDMRSSARLAANKSPSRSPARKRRPSAPVVVVNQDALTAPPPTAGAPSDEAKGLSGDWGAIMLLLLLYTLQGVPMGLAGSVPMLLQEKNVNMAEQAKFSFVSWPFSLKLLWAPLVDSVYSSAIGRRKTWIVPAQAAIGLVLIWAAWHIDDWLGDGDGGSGAPCVGTLTAVFFGLFFLAATQDIAVDGLALTVLSARNKELGATCNAIGQSVGYQLAFTVFIGLNKYGYVSLGGFMAFWGVIFLASTLWVAAVKNDEHAPLPAGLLSSLTATYREMFVILQLASVRLTCMRAHA